MPNRGFRGLAGQPVRPYAQKSINAGSTCWLDLTFLNRYNSAVAPSSVVYRIDNLSSGISILEDTAASPAALTSIMIPGTVNVISGDGGQNSQTNQVMVTATYSDSSTATEVFIYEIIALQTAGN